MYYLASMLVGGLFILSALTKVLDPIYFMQHLSDLRLMRGALVVPTSFFLTSVQGFVGMTLVLGFLPRIMLPVSMAALFLFLILTLRGHFVSSIDDCGCYGGFVRLTVLQSVVLDGVLMTMLLVGGYSAMRSEEQFLSLWQVVLSAIVGIFFGGFSVFSYQYYLRHQKLILDLSPIRSGKKWKESWLGTTADFSKVKGDRLVVFMASSCSICKAWVKVLNVMHNAPNLPEVNAIVGINEGSEVPERVRCELQAQFPVITCNRSRVSRLVRSALPTAILLDDGIIRGKWNRRIPSFLVDRLRLGLREE